MAPQAKPALQVRDDNEDTLRAVFLGPPGSGKGTQVNLIISLKLFP